MCTKNSTKPHNNIHMLEWRTACLSTARSTRTAHRTVHGVHVHQDGVLREHLLLLEVEHALAEVDVDVVDALNAMSPRLVNLHAGPRK